MVGKRHCILKCFWQEDPRAQAQAQAQACQALKGRARIVPSLGQALHVIHRLHAFHTFHLRAHRMKETGQGDGRL